MSGATVQSTGTVPALVGGIATKSQDLAASIIFAVAYASLVPLAIYRFAKPETRMFTLVKPFIFVQLQVAGFAIRAVLATSSDPNETLYIVSQVFMLAGSVLIAEPVISLLLHMIGANTLAMFRNRGMVLEHPYPFQARVLRLCQSALIAAIVIGIVGALKVSPNDSAATLQQISDMRVANAGLIIGAMAAALICAGTLMGFHVTSRKSFLLMIQCVMVIIFAAYRLAIAKAQPDPLATSTKITFYVLNPLPQLVCCVLYFVPKVKQLYPEAHFQPRARPTYDDQYPQSGYLPNAAQYSNNSGYNPNQPSYPPPMSPSKEEYKQVV